MISKVKRMVELNLNEVEQLINFHQAQIEAATHQKVQETIFWSTERALDLREVVEDMKSGTAGQESRG